MPDCHDPDSGQCRLWVAVIYLIFANKAIRLHAHEFCYQTGDDDVIHKGINPTLSPAAVGKHKSRLALIFLLCAGVVFGCAQIREVTYPRDFVYLERKELRSKMALLGLYLRQLDEILYRDQTIGPDQQQEILALLKNIKVSTAEFGSGNVTNHLVIDDHIDDFKNDVNTAIHDASANPPNYFAAGRLVGSCAGCHQFRD